MSVGQEEWLRRVQERHEQALRDAFNRAFAGQSNAYWAGPTPPPAFPFSVRSCGLIDLHPSQWTVS